MAEEGRRRCWKPRSLGATERLEYVNSSSEASPGGAIRNPLRVRSYLAASTAVPSGAPNLTTANLLLVQAGEALAPEVLGGEAHPLAPLDNLTRRRSHRRTKGATGVERTFTVPGDDHPEHRNARDALGIGREMEDGSDQIGRSRQPRGHKVRRSTPSGGRRLRLRQNKRADPGPDPTKAKGGNLLQVKGDRNEVRPRAQLHLHDKASR